MTQQKVPHKHAALIKQWADGAEIQYLATPAGSWRDAPHPGWGTSTEYRVKPEPDVVLYACIEKETYGDGSPKARVGSTYANENRLITDTCMFVFDGETGKLKDCQVLANV